MITRHWLTVKAGAVALLMTLSIGASCADPPDGIQEIRVGPRSFEHRLYTLQQGDQVQGTLSITGGTANDIDFHIKDPTGKLVVNLGRVKDGASFQFSAPTGGPYLFVLSNQFSILSEKLIVANWTTPTRSLTYR